MVFSKKFICRSQEINDYARNVPAPYLRKAFSLPNKPKKAEISVCGLGFYRLWLNGKEITKGMLAPYISNPDDILYYDVYDVSSLLDKGKNAVAILLGNGFLNNPGGDIWDFDKAAFRSAPKTALALEADGKLLFEADETFRTADSPIFFDDYRAGERYDARREIPGWNEVGFDDSAWDFALPAKTPSGEARAPICEPVRAVRELAPRAFEKRGNGWLYSFPENNAGVCRLKIRGNPGQKLVLTYGEIASENGVDIENILFENSVREYMHKDVYICRGGEESYTPSFVYHGFQYVYIEGLEEGQAQQDTLTYLVMHSDLKSAGAFSCSDEILNRLQENTRRSDLANFYYFPTDCPHREKNGWTGDAALSAEQLMLNFHAENSLREWLNNLRAAQKESGELPGIVPTAGWGFKWGNGPAWDTVIVQLPYYIYKYTGDLTAVKENFPAVCRYLGYAKGKLNESGLLAYGLGDWCPVGDENLELTKLEITDTLTILDFCYKGSVLAELLREGEKKAEFDAFYNLLKVNFRKKYIRNGEIAAPYATQTSVAMALYYRAFAETERETAAEQLLGLIREKGDRFDTGVLGARVLFRVLSDLGHASLAYKLIAQPGFPSYRYHVEYGATTLWENFIKLKDGEIRAESGRKLDSLNHHFWGDISAWFYKYVAGINVNPGLKDPYTVEIAPQDIEGIGSCRAELDYMGGKIRVEWSRETEGIALNVSVPEGIKVIRRG